MVSYNIYETAFNVRLRLLSFSLWNQEANWRGGKRLHGQRICL